jgi:hypothetical protein
VTETTIQRFAIEDRRAALELLGKHWDIWKDSLDPDEVFERLLLGIPKHLIPAKLDDPIQMRLSRDGSYAAPKESDDEEVEGPVEGVSHKSQ